MAEFRVKQVGCKERVHEYSLETYNKCPLEKTWLSYIQEDDQVEPLIISLFNKVMNPSVVSLHCSETSKVSAHPPDHTRDTGHCF